MPRASTKHKDRESQVKFENFSNGLNKDQLAMSLGVDELSICRNMKYFVKKDGGGVGLKMRQGVVKITTTTLPAGADVLACTYYIAQSKYILATDAKIYYLSSGVTPVEIGSIDGIPTFTEFKSKLIIHDTGVTKAWDGTTFETLNKLIQEENLGTGNNSTTRFTGTLANLTVKVSSITITFTDTTTKTITDDGAGALIGNVNGGGTNTINYTTGAYDFTCSGAPDTSTAITIDYEQVAGAPKSKAGMVRASRLYMWGDADNKSRLNYSGVNDEDGWDDSSGGGYLDVDPDDGYGLVSVLNFFQSLVLIKQNSLHRLDNFPGDAVFQVEPLIDNVGAIAYRTALNDGDLITFLSDNAWLALSPSERYGDIQKTVKLSKSFSKEAAQYAIASAYAEYNQIDNQLWLTLSDNIYVINLATGGQLSLYDFTFTHSSYKYVNDKMLIGGSDGNLYRMVDDESVFKDNGVVYKANLRSSYFDLGIPFKHKHNKKIYLKISGQRGVDGTLGLYKDQSYSSFEDITIDINTVDNVFIYDAREDIYDSRAAIGIASESDILLKKKFNYREIMFSLYDLYGAGGVEVQGLSFISAVIGAK